MTMLPCSFMLFFFIFNIHVITGNLDISCKTVRSQVSGTSNGATTSAICDSSSNFPTLVSCGFSTKEETQHPAVENFEGSYIEGSRCYARNALDGTGVYAWARCCGFEQTVTCSASNGKSADSNDGLSTLHCPENKYMLGCSAYTTSKHFDGVFPGDAYPTEISHYGSSNPYEETRTCNGRNGILSDTHCNINCCTASIGLECNVYYQSASKENELQCPSDQTMIACMATEPHQTANAWYIQRNSDSNPHACTTRGYSNTYGVHTVAICCNEQTKSPTKAPSTDPTKCPTAPPSDAPSTSPTDATAEPTEQTVEPSSPPTHTRAPTVEPTASTKDPSIVPTLEPTNDPSETPTDAPSAQPSHETSDPSLSPSVPPSSAPTGISTDPSEAPTKDPSVSPTDDPSVSPVIEVTDDDGDDDEDDDDEGNNGKGGRYGADGDKEKSQETLYLVLAIIFGVLLCCVLAGVFYYFYYKNRKQSNEVMYENAGVSMKDVKSVDASEAYKVMGDNDVDAAILRGVNTIGTNEVEGLTNSGTGTGTGAETGTGTAMIDASVGIKTADGNNTTEPDANKQVSSAPVATYAPATATRSAVSGMSDEDEQKATVFSVEM